ncbi:MATE family efflux transporter [uncultured Faecalicoccus sp.]|uniref:MATE family efflux transporter n=1 Tax=uncultured Faecalicoccus sp. TaxID=1971760 RepID=UPI002611AC66|nr:MATE family efflux transporter [uncultured Faecalicoccus sp.]
MQNDTLSRLRNGEALNLSEQIKMILLLAIPAILSQISSTAMQYIDASMVGSLGAQASASIGLVSSTTWMFGGVSFAIITGFTVQVAHAIGAKAFVRARNIMKQGFLFGEGFALALALIGAGISSFLPGWLGGTPEILQNAFLYFLVFALFLPFQQLNYLATGMLQASGNMKVPSLLNILMCILDVFFNMFFIFYLDLGVMGASIGTGCSQLVVSLLMCGFLFFKSEFLHLRKEEKFYWDKEIFSQALRIGLPVGLDRLVTSSAYVAFTRIVSPLGTIAIAANSFGITAESLCYMPGYGVQSAAITLIGQSIGAKRKDLTYRLGVLTTLLGTGLMTCSGMFMYFGSPLMMHLLSPDAQIVALGVQILRIEAFAEPMYGASIVVAGVLQGAGDTLSSSLMNLVSMWCVRIPLAAILAGTYGLPGVWFAMALELNVRGILFLIRLVRKKWLYKLENGSSIVFKQ